MTGGGGGMPILHCPSATTPAGPEAGRTPAGGPEGKALTVRRSCYCTLVPQTTSSRSCCHRSPLRAFIVSRAPWSSPSIHSSM